MTITSPKLPGKTLDTFEDTDGSKVAFNNPDKDGEWITTNVYVDLKTMEIVRLEENK